MNLSTRTPSTVPLSELATFNRPAPNLATGDEVAFVPMAAVSELGTMQVAEHLRAADLRPGYNYMQTGDVLVAKITPCFENNKIAVARLDREHGFGSTEFHVIRTNEAALDNRYLVHFLRQDSIRRAGEKRMTGSAGQRRVPRHFFEELTIPLPPLDEQRRIAAILDQADDLRRKRREALKSLDSLSEIIFSKQFGDLVENEKGWTIEPLAATIDNFEGGKNIVADGDESGNPARVLKISAIQADGFNDRESKALPEDYEPPERHFVHFGDLLLSRANTTERVGLVALVDHEVDNLVLPDKILRFIWKDKSAACVVYWLYCFRSAGVRSLIGRLATGTSGSMKNISQEKLLTMKLALPPLELQRAFAARATEIDTLKAEHRAHLAKLDALFASLQHRAFRGEL